MLQEILVDEWGFDGYVVSDWGGSNDHALGVKTEVILRCRAPENPECMIS